MIKLSRTVLFLIVCIFAFNLNADAQACGRSFLYLYLKESNGTTIKNAEISFIKNNQHVSEQTTANWIQEEQAYLISHSMCNEHRSINLKISAKGFETVENDFAFFWGVQDYTLKLKREGSKEQTVIEQLASFDGYVEDANGEDITNINVTLTDQNGKKFETVTNENGRYWFKVKSGQYKIEFISAKGFATIKFDNLELPKGQPFLKTVLPIDPKCDDCLITELICKENDWGRNVCELITKNIKQK